MKVLAIESTALMLSLYSLDVYF